MTEEGGSLVELIGYALVCLLGEEGKHWVYYETDPEWWCLRAWLRRN